MVFESFLSSCLSLLRRYVRAQRRNQTFCFLCPATEQLGSLKERIRQALQQHSEGSSAMTTPATTTTSDNNTINPPTAIRLLLPYDMEMDLDDTETIQQYLGGGSTANNVSGALPPVVPVATGRNSTGRSSRKNNTSRGKKNNQEESGGTSHTMGSSGGGNSNAGLMNDAGGGGIAFYFVLAINEEMEEYESVDVSSIDILEASPA